jgi:hypothetical protein
LPGRKEITTMKKIYTTFVLVLFATQIFAQRGKHYNNFNNNTNIAYPSTSATATTSALHLTFPATNNYTITVGTQSLSFYGSTFFLENLPAGLQMVSVRYTTNGNNSNWQTTYNGAVNFEANTRIFATVDAYGILRITQREAIAQAPVVVCPPQQTTPNYYPQVVFATQQQANDLVSRLTNISFDSKKVQTAKNALKANNFTAQQVKQILQVFSFDSYKLDVAKYAYDVSQDRANFFVVGGAFSFSSYADDLEQYIATH